MDRLSDVHGKTYKRRDGLRQIFARPRTWTDCIGGGGDTGNVLNVVVRAEARSVLGLIRCAVVEATEEAPFK